MEGPLLVGDLIAWEYSAAARFYRLVIQSKSDFSSPPHERIAYGELAKLVPVFYIGSTLGSCGSEGITANLLTKGLNYIILTMTEKGSSKIFSNFLLSIFKSSQYTFQLNGKNFSKRCRDNNYFN